MIKLVKHISILFIVFSIGLLTFQNTIVHLVKDTSELIIQLPITEEESNDDDSIDDEESIFLAQISNISFCTNSTKIYFSLEPLFFQSISKKISIPPPKTYFV